MRNINISYSVKIFCKSFIVLVLSIGINLHAQDFQFVRQSVNMRIDKGNFLVSGLYFVKGTPNAYTTITFPFPHGPAYSTIDSIHIYDVTKDSYITPDEINDLAVNFTVKFDDSDEYLFQLYYKLKLLGGKAEYKFSLNEEAIESLDKACFYLIAPTELGVRKFSYPPKDTIDAGENTVFYWEMYDFTPKENLTFRFRSFF